MVEPREVQPDHVLEQHEVVLARRSGQPDEPRDHLGGNVDHRQAALGRTDGSVGRSDTTRHRARLTRCGKGCPGSIASGVTTGRSVLWKYASTTFGLLRGDFLRPDDPDALGDQPRLDVLEEGPVLLLDERVHPLGDRGQRLGRGQPVGGGALVSRPDALLEIGHPDHEELVEVRAEDGQELDALEERHRLDPAPLPARGG